jgi:hypothetical protein
MPFYLFIFSRLVAYPIRQAVQSIGSTFDYTDEKDEGHVDTREKNFDCEDKDPNLGCDPGIDVAG